MSRKESNRESFESVSNTSGLAYFQFTHNGQSHEFRRMDEHLIKFPDGSFGIQGLWGAFNKNLRTQEVAITSAAVMFDGAVLDTRTGQLSIHLFEGMYRNKSPLVLAETQWQTEPDTLRQLVQEWLTTVHPRLSNCQTSLDLLDQLASLVTQCTPLVKKNKAT